MASATLYVCTTCRKGTTEQPCPGARLHGAILALEAPEGVEVVGVECLSACGNGCAIALAAPGKWTYLYGGLDPAAHAGEILRGAALYAQSADGMPPWRERPEIFRKNVIGRTPPLPDTPPPAGKAVAMSTSVDKTSLDKTSLAKTPVTIITGFLGAGKTTLIRHLMAQPQGKRLAVLVNEFGALGVDGEILKSCADANCPAENIIELANGCICCTVADDFIPAMEQLLALPHKPDHILIETSGLALPKPLLKAFDWPAIRSRITVDGVIALADAEAVAAGVFAPKADAAPTAGEGSSGPAEAQLAEHHAQETPLSEVFEDQIACADLVLLTKSDLADAAARAAARRHILAEAPRQPAVIEIARGVIDPRLILGLNAAAEADLAARPSHHDGEDGHEHDDFATLAVSLPEIDNIEALKAAIRSLAREQHILRVKGYVAVRGKPLRLLVQAVGERVTAQFDRPFAAEPRRSHLVVIAEHHHLDAAAIKAALGA